MSFFLSLWSSGDVCPHCCCWSLVVPPPSLPKRRSPAAFFVPQRRCEEKLHKVLLTGDTNRQCSSASATLLAVIFVSCLGSSFVSTWKKWLKRFSFFFSHIKRCPLSGASDECSVGGGSPGLVARVSAQGKEAAHRPRELELVHGRPSPRIGSFFRSR